MLKANRSIPVLNCSLKVLVPTTPNKDNTPGNPPRASVKLAIPLNTFSKPSKNVIKKSGSRMLS